MDRIRSHEVPDDSVDPHSLLVAVLQSLQLLRPFGMSALVQLRQLPLQVRQLVLNDKGLV